MIREIILTSRNNAGETHIAPMGVHDHGQQFLVIPFKPSTTLDNILDSRCAVINYTDDVRIFAGCLIGRRDWSLCETERVSGQRLVAALAHTELKLVKVEDDDQRPRLFCEVVHESSHKPFRGFNRAQFSVIEAAILVSRLHMLPLRKVETELEYLRIGLEKTAGETEFEAWEWLIQHVNEFRENNPERVNIS